MKKILIISFYSGHISRGVENWAKQIQNNLHDPSEFKVRIFQGGPADNPLNFSIRTKIDWNKKDTQGSILRKFFLDYRSLKILVFALQIIPEVIRYNPDVIVPTDGGWESPIIRIYTWLRRKKMVIVGHSGIGWDDRFNLYSFPDAFVALSKKACEWAKKVNPFLQVHYIPNGIDLEKFSPSGKRITTSLKKPIIICVGAFIESKRQELLINACSNIESENFSLFLVGDGDKKNNLKRLGYNTLGKERFDIKSFDFDDMPKVYRTADLFTLPSVESEAFGMVFLEAMASGLPVVANKDPIRSEIVGKAGILVNVKDKKEYADALQKALNSDLGELPRNQAKKFSWKVVAKKYKKVFNSLK